MTTNYKESIEIIDELSSTVLNKRKRNGSSKVYSVYDFCKDYGALYPKFNRWWCIKAESERYAFKITPPAEPGSNNNKPEMN